MKRIMTVSAVTALLAMTTGTAFAADKEGVYVTVGGTLLSTELDLTDLEFEGQTFDFGTEDLDVTMINGRIGYRLNNYFAVEGELGFGLGGDEVDRTIPVQVDILGTVNADVNADLKVKNYYIAFARGILPVAEQFDIFARVGYGEATAEADITGTALGFTLSGTEEQSESGFAYGLGAQFNLTDNDGIRADYTRLDETNIISLAYSRRF